MFSIKTRSAAAIGGALALTLVVSGCSSPNSDSDSGERVVHAQFAGDPTTFNPAAASAADDQMAASILFDTLIKRDDDGSPIGGLATEWEAESASKFVLTIRKDATCADGTVITATDVANSLSYYGDSTAGTHTGAALTFGPGDPKISSDESASTVTIETATPYADLIVGLSTPQAGIICPAGLADLDGLKAGKVEGAFSGPYTLTQTKPGVDYTFTLRDDYSAWPNFSKPLTGTPVKTIVVTLLTDESTSVNQVLSGDMDIVGVTGSQLKRFNKDDFNTLQTVSGNMFIVFNERPGRYFTTPERREAAAQVIDRTAWNKIFSDGQNELFNTLVPSTYACAVTDDSGIVPLDSAAGAKVLAGANIKLVTANAFGAQDRDSEYIQKVLTDAGATVDMQVLDLAGWATAVNDPAGDWDLTIWGDGNTLGVIGATLARVMGPAIEDGGRNVGAVDNPVGAQALVEGQTITDADQRCAVYETAQKTMFERVDAIPLAGASRLWPLPKDLTVRTPGNFKPDLATVRFVD